MERSNGDSNRGNSQDNGMRPQLTTSTNVPQKIDKMMNGQHPLFLREEILWGDNK